ncbi:MAG: hypothetical protein FD163_1134 [Hyphomonadaceae bacterium]|nr:MAG: hypothetical protein FD128_1749 [Hyphomonadaceae bacterium]KAF0185319.1 MAG: hypothetical protein FD163_1134 [Hyphomonadaceae bacterium]
MFIGHYCAAFAARAHAPDAPKLGLLFLAAQAVDIGFFTLLAGGIERVSHDENIRGIMPIILEYMPFTHSLVATSIWAAGAFFLTKNLVFKGQAKPALIFAIVVASHWFLDLPVHRADLPIWGNEMKQGFGLWNFPIVAMIFELSLLWASIYYYIIKRGMAQISRPWFIGLLTFLLLAQAINWFSPSASNVLQLSIMGIAAYLVAAYLALKSELRSPSRQ